MLLDHRLGTEEAWRIGLVNRVVARVEGLAVFVDERPPRFIHR
jgi:enoyl-CoA hydratase/carnithine racemase